MRDREKGNIPFWNLCLTTFQGNLCGARPLMTGWKSREPHGCISSVKVTDCSSPTRYCSRSWGKRAKWLERRVLGELALSPWKTSCCSEMHQGFCYLLSLFGTFLFSPEFYLACSTGTLVGLHLQCSGFWQQTFQGGSSQTHLCRST